MNKMRELRIEKVTLNVGAGKDQGKLEKGIKLLKLITGIEPVKTLTMKRVPTWGLRPNLPIGCKITIRKDTEALLKRLLYAKDFKLKESNIDNNGSISFGIHEYVDVEGIDYNHDVGLMGFEVSVTLERPGFRIKRRAVNPRKINNKHKISKEESIEFLNSKFNVKVGDE